MEKKKKTGAGVFHDEQENKTSGLSGKSVGVKMLLGNIGMKSRCGHFGPFLVYFSVFSRVFGSKHRLGRCWEGSRGTTMRGIHFRSLFQLLRACSGPDLKISPTGVCLAVSVRLAQTAVLGGVLTTCVAFGALDES